MHKYIFAAAFVALSSTACLAAQQFYVTQEATTKHCEIGPEKPDGVKKIMLGAGPYATRAEAKAAKKAAPECKGPAPSK
jgi:hypothetical protein